MTLAVNIAQSGSNNVTFRNKIINGGMVIDQRNAGSAVTLTATTAAYITDRWYCNNTSDAVLSVVRDTSAPSGFTNSTKVTVSTADASIGATQNSYLAQWIEGFNTADLAWGTASASPITLSFWVRSSLTGTFGGAITNSAISRSYPYTYTISSANTWEQKSVTIAGDTTGTWLTDNGVGVRLWFALGTGSTYLGTAGAWAGTEYRGATGQTQIISTLNATWQVTGVQLEAGTTASPFEYRQYGTELFLCERYFQVFANNGTGQPISSGSYFSSTNFMGYFNFRTKMRTDPTLYQTTGTSYWTVQGNGTVANKLNSISLDRVTPQSLMYYNVTEASGTQGVACIVYSNNSATYLACQAEL